MDTYQLRAIQHPSAATALLESWACSQNIMPADGCRVCALSELSEPLRRLADRCDGGDSVWCAWTSGLHTWFVAAALSLELARERRQPVLQIKVYNEDGEMTAVATCVHTVHHGWQQCS